MEHLHRVRVRVQGAEVTGVFCRESQLCHNNNKNNNNKQSSGCSVVPDPVGSD